MHSSSGSSAYQMVFGSNPADFFGWADGDEDVLFAQETPLAGQFVKQWKLRARAQEATLKEVANGDWLLERNKASNCAEIDVGDMVLFYKAQNRKSLPRRRGPATSWRLMRLAPLYRFRVKLSKMLVIAYVVA